MTTTDRVHDGQVTRRRVVIRMAQARGDHSHAHLVPARLVDDEVNDLVGPRRLPDDGSSGLHSRTSSFC